MIDDLELEEILQSLQLEIPDLIILDNCSYSPGISSFVSHKSRPGPCFHNGILNVSRNPITIMYI